MIILVEPQLGENIGMAARAMGNFALTQLRLVNPRDGWPNIAAQRAAAGADHILDHVELFDTVEQAVADLDLLFATTARAHDQAKPVVAPEAAAREIVGHIGDGGKAGILFGRERYGLTNEEVARANRIITFPVNPGFASLNLAQAVLLMGYEWFKLSTARRPAVRDARALGARLPAPDGGVLRESGARARQGRIPAAGGKARHHAGQPAQHLLRAWSRPSRTCIRCMAWSWRSRKGARGRPRAACSMANRRRGCARCLPSTGRVPLPSDSAARVRGLARLLRRNPTDAERILWQALTRDRRFAGQFKRQTPVGRHIPDFVSFRASPRDRAGQSG